MRIFLLANNWVGLEIARYLKSKRENIIALGVHEIEKQKYTKEIINTVKTENIFSAGQFKLKKTLTKIKNLDPDIIIAAFWGYILKPELINLTKIGCINFHPGFLPYNRGMNPNVWPFIESTPAGVSLHFIDKGIDTGDIIAQKKIEIEPVDTAGSLEKKTWNSLLILFKKTWPKIKNNSVRRIAQSNSYATYHLAKQVDELDFIDFNKKYLAKDLIQKLKARSYPNHSFAYYLDQGKKIYINIKLSYTKDF
ncbi:hypothetical protein A2954_01385 [Candidatus Roizmanbacteria bacterium RIFCSPLOWO2_01_FULL_37_12]|uniref:Formyl transferase N-terminal domain-containing protein n=1 Tax=Candidatus Roizmanbacteria bacterium RIFCSPLOWO2_01_FULL_37_12 TaxID=1802056 RepID=A0A1F7IGJ0_9BACT|nr:MAG: hypothetical protein A2954_01385 [Candidatus Roizmanbacteria bacterium RIFCSPLOWO2_01_FULL_37_12]